MTEAVLRDNVYIPGSEIRPGSEKNGIFLDPNNSLLRTPPRGTTTATATTTP